MSTTEITKGGLDHGADGEAVRDVARECRQQRRCARINRIRRGQDYGRRLNYQNVPLLQQLIVLDGCQNSSGFQFAAHCSAALGSQRSIHHENGDQNAQHALAHVSKLAGEQRLDQEIGNSKMEKIVLNKLKKKLKKYFYPIFKKIVSQIKYIRI